ncbi:MAG: HXXEE domain-containing protein [Enhygromyxa sp.]
MSVVVSTLHLFEEVAFFEHVGVHHQYFGFGDSSRYEAFVWTTIKQDAVHIALVLIALTRGGLWRRYICQFLAVVFFLMSGVLFVLEVLYTQRYVAGSVTGALLVVPFFAMFLGELARREEMSRRSIAAWMVAAPALAVAIILGLLT